MFDNFPKAVRQVARLKSIGLQKAQEGGHRIILSSAKQLKVGETIWFRCAVCGLAS